MAVTRNMRAPGEEGISKVGEIVDLGVEAEVIQKSGSWFNYESTKLGQGGDAVKQLFTDNPEMADEIEKKIREKLLKEETEPVADKKNAN